MSLGWRLGFLVGARGVHIVFTFVCPPLHKVFGRRSRRTARVVSMETKTHRHTPFTPSLVTRLGLPKRIAVLGCALGLLFACGSATTVDTNSSLGEVSSPGSQPASAPEQTPTLDALNGLTRGVASFQGLPERPVPTRSAESCARAENATFNAMPSGICRTEQYAWTGSSCMPIDDPACLVGGGAAPNPEDIYADSESCEAAHAHCGL